MTFADAITQRILSLCAERHITVNRLATLSGMTQSTLENVVKGITRSPGIVTLYRISRGFGMTVSQLLDFPEMNESIFDDE